MKKIFLAVLFCLPMFFLSSCRGLDGLDGLPGRDGRDGLDGVATIKTVIINVPESSWEYSDVDNNNYFSATVDVPEITEDAFDYGLIKMYRVYDYGKSTAAQVEMPYIRLKEWCPGDVDGDGYDDWYFYTEEVDYEIGIGGVTICYTASDFDYELDESFIPEAMQFRCVVML